MIQEFLKTKKVVDLYVHAIPSKDPRIGEYIVLGMTGPRHFALFRLREDSNGFTLTHIERTYGIITEAVDALRAKIAEC